MLKWTWKLLNYSRLNGNTTSYVLKLNLYEMKPITSSPSPVWDVREPGGWLGRVVTFPFHFRIQVFTKKCQVFENIFRSKGKSKERRREKWYFGKAGGQWKRNNILQRCNYDFHRSTLCFFPLFCKLTHTHTLEHFHANIPTHTHSLVFVQLTISLIS